MRGARGQKAAAAHAPARAREADGARLAFTRSSRPPARPPPSDSNHDQNLVHTYKHCMRASTAQA